METGFFAGLKRFFFPKEDVYDYWYAPVDHFQFVTADFYQLIERELTARQVPGLEITRVEWNEGGLLSGKREYLRLKRERLVFDICAAPFGTSYFFSFRSVELPLGIKPLEVLIFMVGIVIIFSLLAKLFGLIFGILVFLGIVGVGMWLMRNAVALGLKHLDASLLKTPILGPLYELFFRKETYYRKDTRVMYLTTVDSITKALVDKVTAAKGIKLVKRFGQRPIFGELYRDKTDPPDAPIPPAAKPT